MQLNSQRQKTLKQLKIIIAIPCLNYGGTEMQTLNFVKVLVGSGHTVTIICYFEHDLVMENEYKNAGCKIELMNLQRVIQPWKLTNLLYKKFKETKPDVVHVQYMAPGALPIIAARLARVKRIFATVHQPWTKEFHGIKAKILVRFSTLLTTRFIVVSENAEKSWFGNSALFDSADTKIAKRSHFTIYNSIDLVRLDKIIIQANISETKVKLGWENTFVIGAVSRLRYEKGIDLLLIAFSNLVPFYENIRLMIVGNGPDEALLKSFAIEKKIETKVFFAGKKNWEESMGLMNLMDIVVCPSRFEGFGLTAAEALAMSKPVIASSVYGLKEVVISGENGLTFTVDNINELTQCLNSLINNIHLQQKFGQKGRQRVKRVFSLETFKRKITELY